MIRAESNSDCECEIELKLYDYHRSSAAYRVRIVMNLKGLDYEQLPVNLLDDEQHSRQYSELNPQQLVPALQTSSGILTQSLAIIEYLEQEYPDRPVLAVDTWERARQRAMAQLIACDVHPINNLRVLNYLRGPLKQPEEEVQRWIRHWIELGFSALEAEASDQDFLGGDRPMLPDVTLVPQMYNARRFKVALAEYPRLVAIADRCNALREFADAAPG